jgi:hypothetical protein
VVRRDPLTRRAAQCSVGADGVCGARAARPSAVSRLGTVAPAPPRSSTRAFGGSRSSLSSSRAHGRFTSLLG